MVERIAGTSRSTNARFGNPEMPGDQDSFEVPLPEGDFRRGRVLLPPEAFALAEGPDPPIDDLVSKQVWNHLIQLADDVALRTTNWQGSTTDLINRISAQWLFAVPIEPIGAPFAPEPALLTSEEFQALEFIALHGYYRQALGCLRNALETMTHAARYAASGQALEFWRWRKGDLEPKFGSSRASLLLSKAGGEIEQAVAPGSVFGTLERHGWLAGLYRRLCSYAHSQGGSNNADFWESNGPVYAATAYELVLDELRETVAACYVLFKVCWPEFALPRDLDDLLDRPALSNWPDIAKLALKRVRASDERGSAEPSDG